MNNENLGPAERIIQTVLAYSDHMVHNRPGMLVKDPTDKIGVKWIPVTHKVENGEKVVYQMAKAGKKTNLVRVGVIQPTNQIKEAGRIVAEYRPAGIFPEVAAWMYQQVADVWKLDNEFAARWASYAFAQDHRDLKVVLAAFMLVQSRKGDPILDGGKVAFHDEDFRDIGEAIVLIQDKDTKVNPKLLLRIYDVLMVPSIAKINHDLGFGRSARHPFLGRWEKAVEKWLLYREENPKLLAGLIKAGFRRTIIDLSRRIGYKPQSPKFFEALRWKQDQAEDGRRSIAIGVGVKAAESWDLLTEAQICEKICREKPNYKRVVGLLPKGIGLTRAIVAASIESGCLSNKDLIIQTPTLEELGLLQDPDIRRRWEHAVKSADDMRAANIATRVKSKETQEKLMDASDNALKKAAEEVTRGVRIYFMVDISSSMTNSIEHAKTHIAKFLQAFPLDRVHVATFNTTGREVSIKHASAAGVTNAFAGISASGGTDHGSPIRAQCLGKYKPGPEEDALFIYVGDEEQPGTFAKDVRDSGLNPVAFGLIQVATKGYSIVRDTAVQLGIPCFLIDERTFADPYAIPRTIRALIAATPVGKATVRQVAPARVSLAETILNTKLLVKPNWAA